MKNKYIFDQAKFDSWFIRGGKFTHRVSESSIQVFPFSASAKTAIIDQETFKDITGSYFLAAEGMKCKKLIHEDDLTATLINSDILEIDEEKKELFRQILEDRFFTREGKLKPESLLALELAKTDSEERDLELEKRVDKNADYLNSVLGTASSVKKTVEQAKKQEKEEFDVLQKFFYSYLSDENVTEICEKSDHYFKIFDGFNEVYDADLNYLLLRKQRFSSRDLVNLLRLYYLTYISQTIETLNQFLSGSRTRITPLYFILSWEKISHSRLAANEGWEQLKSLFPTLFSQQVTLVILNQIQEIADTDMNGKPFVFDYIKLNQYIQDGKFSESEVAAQIHEMADYYRKQISDSKKMTEYARDFNGIGTVKDEIRYLYNSIKIQFQSTDRSRISNTYPLDFEKITSKFQKNKGRLGKVLAIDEEMLLFMTKIAIKDQSKIRLNDLFKQFELRGVYLDNTSKQEAADFFERLNLIEKKSDSGDAKYVKNI